MPDIQTTLATRTRRAVVAAFGEDYADVDPMIRPSGQPQFGDYQANLAMSLKKTIGESPRDIAQKIIDHLDLSHVCEKVELAGPGFINLHLSKAFLNDRINMMARDGRLGVSNAEPALNVVVDYSSPNVAKEMHVGHLRSSIIGDSIARVLTFLGHHVIRQNHIGDWGTQFGMLIEHLTELGWDQQGEHSISDLNVLYKEAKLKFDEDSDFKERARLRVVSLQSGDSETLSLWTALINESKRHFNQAYRRLGVQLTDDDIRAESFYNDRLADVIIALEDAGVLKESEGAKVVFPPGFNNKDGDPLPMIVQKSDGGYLYATTDLAAVQFRVAELDADRIIYVTDARQADHFAMFFWTAKNCGWLKSASSLEHVVFGTVLGEDSKPLKSRSGDPEKLVSLLDMATAKAREVVDEKNAGLSEQERAKVAETVGIGALKYADLSSDRIKDYKFSPDRMLAFEGNTAPYIQNAYVRVHGIFRKGDIDQATLADKTIMVGDDAERVLAVKLLQLSSVIDSVAESLEPHRLCTYLYELAASFHKFFENCPVLSANDDATRCSRLRLCELTSQTFKTGLGLLGIEVVERM
jgi:arginyl-tRNA synthetase